MNSITLVPTGSHEYHGMVPQPRKKEVEMPLATDTILAETYANRTARVIGAAGIAVYVEQPERIGMSEEHRDFPGTQYLTSLEYVPRIQQRLDDIADRRNDTFIVVVNAHGGNKGALGMIAPEFNYQHDNMKMFVSDIYSKDMQKEAERLLGQWTDHGGTVEGSLLAAEGVLDSVPAHHDERYVKKMGSHQFYYFRTRQFQKLAIMQNTSELVIDGEKGAELRDFIVKEVAANALYWYHELNRLIEQ